MSEQDLFGKERRHILKLLGSSAVVVPLAGLAACSGDDTAPAASAPADKPAEPAADANAAADSMQETMQDGMDEATEAAAEQPAGGQAATDLPLLDESNPQAKSLGYVHEASSVDAGKYPRYESGQACSNCALYMGGDAPQGACSIFPGKAVKATGWCSVYAPKAG